MDRLTCGKCGETENVPRFNNNTMCESCLFWYDLAGLDSEEVDEYE